MKKIKIRAIIIYCICFVICYFMFSTRGIYYRSFSDDDEFSVHAEILGIFYFLNYIVSLDLYRVCDFGKIVVADLHDGTIIKEFYSLHINAVNTASWHEDYLIFKGMDGMIHLPRKVKDSYSISDTNGITNIYSAKDQLVQTLKVHFINGIGFELDTCVSYNFDGEISSINYTVYDNCDKSRHLSCSEFENILKKKGKIVGVRASKYYYKYQTTVLIQKIDFFANGSEKILKNCLEIELTNQDIVIADSLMCNCFN